MNTPTILATSVSRPRRSLRRKLGFSLAILFLFLGCLELGFRLFWERPPATVGDPFILNKVFVPDADCGWRMKPEVEMHYELYAGVEFNFRTNAAGRRSRERTNTTRPAGKTRVVVVGDSFAFGWGVEDHATFAWRLEDQLPNTEVYNLGVSGYNVAQSHRMLVADGLALNPDVVVFTFFANDVMTQDIPDMVALRTAANRRRSGPKSFKMILADNCYLAGFLRHSISTIRPLRRAFQALGLKDQDGGFDELDEIVRPNLREYPESMQRVWTDTIREVSAMHATCRRAGTKFLLVAIPSRQALLPDDLAQTLAYVKFEPAEFDMRKCATELGKACAARGIEFLDGTTALQAPDDRYFIYFDMHLNSAGHRVLADAIQPVLQRMLVAR